MYDLLIRSFLKETLKALGSMDAHTLQILLESVKTRNEMALRRFDASLALLNRLSDFNMELEADFDAFKREFKAQHAKNIGVTKKVIKYAENTREEFVLQIFEVFHTPRYRRMRHLTEQFEATNDLLSAYSVVFTELLRADIAKATVTHFKDFSTVSRTYLRLWSIHRAILAVVMRISSYDLRFWLKETSYLDSALSHAEKDRKNIEAYLKTNNSQQLWRLSIEDAKVMHELLA